MNSRIKEANDAVAFAGKMAEAESKGENLLEVLQEYRQTDVLALVPTSAMDLRQLYADLIAEYVVRSGKPEEIEYPEKENIARFGKTFDKKFGDLFGGEENIYRKYAGPVFKTHDLYCKFVEAAAAYALLRPGRKNGEDSKPEETAIRSAMQHERSIEKTITFDVFSNKISPMERYARALSRSLPEMNDLVRIPKVLLSDEKFLTETESASEREVRIEELALATMLYYRYKPDGNGKYTEYYPVAVREIGAYLTKRDQAKALGKLMNKPKLLKFREVYFAGRGDNERRVMVALSKEVVDAFRSCCKQDAHTDNYIEVETKTPRAIVNMIRENIQTKPLEGRLLTAFLTRKEDSENYVPWQQKKDELLAILKKTLDERLQSVSKTGCRGMSPTKQKLFDRVRDPGMCVLKLCIAAYFVRSQNEEWHDESISPEELKSVFNDECENIFQLLEETRKKVFEQGMVMSYGWHKNKSVFHCTVTTL